MSARSTVSGELALAEFLSQPGRKRETGAFAWVAAAAILVGVTMWPWLKPGFDSLDHFIRAGEFGPKHEEVANVPGPCTCRDESDRCSDGAAEGRVEPEQGFQRCRFQS